MTARNVLAPSRILTKTFVKRHVAAAIADAQARNGWSNEDAGDALGCCGNTIVNRKDGDDPGKQMTIFELLRSALADEKLANEIVALVGFQLTPIDRRPDLTSDRKKASSITRAQLAVSIVLEDDEISAEEIVERRQELEDGRDAFQVLLDRVGPKGMIA